MARILDPVVSPLVSEVETDQLLIHHLLVVSLADLARIDAAVLGRATSNRGQGMVVAVAARSRLVVLVSHLTRLDFLWLISVEVIKELLDECTTCFAYAALIGINRRKDRCGGIDKLFNLDHAGVIQHNSLSLHVLLRIR